GLDLIGELRALMKADGRFSDDSKFGDYSNPLGQSFGILALERATPEGAPQAAVDFLLTAQCTDGGFPDAFPKAGAKCSPSPDATGLALQALVAGGADCPATQARAWLKAHQQADGSFADSAVDPAKPAVGNVNSTSYAALGLIAAGESTKTVADYLGSVQSSDGGLAIKPASGDKKSNVYATAQALDAFAGSSFLTIGPSPITPKALACSQTATST
ncbi:MAG: prenyltransferase/squalene oxidase repeat-containing protein, partial [Dermatophilaceae bacterium]